MSDRFPSIEDFDEGQTEARPNNGPSADLMDGPSEDTSDFLSRERAALGDDANQFATPGDNVATTQNGDDDLLGGGGGDISAQTNGAAEDVQAFQSSFPPVGTNQNERVGAGGTITGTSPAPPFSRQQSSFQPPQEEPQVIKEWRERQALAIEAREDAAAQRKAETIKAAHEAVDEFYENYNNKKEKNIAQTRKEAEEFLKNREDTTAGGTSWERIGKLVDLKGAGSKGGLMGSEGKEKFRDLLVGLQKDDKAPGAKGY